MKKENEKTLLCVKQLKKVHVYQLENKNQYIIEVDGFKCFQSYDSLIAVYNYDDGSIMLGCDWDYSNTTRKHLYLFMNQYCALRGVDYLYNKKNKRKYIYKCIKEGIISYNPEMR